MIRALILTGFLSLIMLSDLESAEIIDGRFLTISGHVKDSVNGENLISASIYVKESEVGTVTNSYGFYSLSLAPGSYTIVFSYIGYLTNEQKIDLTENTVLDVDLSKDIRQIEELEITADKSNKNITSLETGTIKLSTEAISRIPSFMGEADLMKVIQFLPGVQNTAEGSSGFSVRGGNNDHNLILLDEATIYNVSHLMGFFSIFNNAAIKDVKFYKGDIPASIGGRLSSLVDIRMKDGNTRKFSGSGGIGFLSSRLTLEGPLIKDRCSFIISGRRSYADIFLPLSKNHDIRDSRLYFYDLNIKLNHIINENNRIYLSGYTGRDLFKNKFAGMGFGNSIIALRWNHLFSGRFFSNFSLIYSDYMYELGANGRQPNSFSWTSDLRDLNFKGDLTYYLNPQHTLKFGFLSTFHIIDPGKIKGKGSETFISSLVLPSYHALEHGVYAMAESKINNFLAFKYGLRLSAMQNLGKATVFRYDSAYQVADSSFYRKGELYYTSGGLEPRLGLTVTINDFSSVKANYSRTRQYLQLAQNSTAGTPLDIWFPSGPNIRPQISDQVAVGYFRNFRDNSIRTSAEFFIKKMQHTIDFKDHAELLLNPFLEGEVRSGTATATGMELLAEFSQKRLDGWIGYTLSRTERKIDQINNNKPFPSPYDRPHNISLVFNYKLTKRLQLGSNWIFYSGNPVTFPVGRHEILGTILPLYSERNSYRLPPYHRLDVSATLSSKNKAGRRWKGEWNLSVYNAYGRKNVWAVNFIQDEDNPSDTYAEKTYLFSVIPSVSYNFNF